MISINMNNHIQSKNNNGYKMLLSNEKIQNRKINIFVDTVHQKLIQKQAYMRKKMINIFAVRAAVLFII